MKVYALAFVLLVLSSSSAPAVDDSAVQLVSQLSWESVGYDHIAMTLFPKAVGRPADELVEIGRPATSALLSALLEPDRAVAAHLVLFRIYFPGRLESGEEPIYSGKDIVALRHTVWGLTWELRSKLMPREEAITRGIDPDTLTGAIERNLGHSYHVEGSALAQNLKKWCRKVPKRYRGSCG